MKIETALFTPNAAKINGTTVAIHGFTGTRPLVTASFLPDNGMGVSVNITGSPDDIRFLAAALVHHAHAAEAAQAERTKAVTA